MTLTSEPRQQQPEQPTYRPACLALFGAQLAAATTMCEWLDIAVQNLRGEHESGGRARTNALAAKYGIRVNDIDISRLLARVTSLQLITVYQHADSFLRSLLDEHPLGEQNRQATRTQRPKSRRHQSSLLEATLRTLNLRKSNVGLLECDIFDYYRGVRGISMHSPLEEQGKVAVTKCKNLREQCAGSPYKHLDAPNRLDALKIDDFVLFRVVAQHLAQQICIVGAPKPADVVGSAKEAANG